MKKEVNVTDRLSYLAEKNDVFIAEDNDLDKLKVSKLDSLTEEEWQTRIISSRNGNILAIFSTKENANERVLTKVSISMEVFSNIVAADPTPNKSCVQWMLNVFTRYIKSGKDESIESAIRFVEEDLPMASEYITLFEANKRKKRFKDMANGSYVLVGITDPTDINQYKSLSQLFDAVDPFIKKEKISAIETKMQEFVDNGKAIIPIRDRKFTVYIPLTRDASVIFHKHVSWCTARKDNENFKSYTTNNKKPNGKNSNIYIIIDNKFFNGESKELYQIHFETNQIKNRRNEETNIFEPVLRESEGVLNFFHDELMGMAKNSSKDIDDNLYINYLIKFGFAESLFEFLPSETNIIKFKDREIPRLPDLSRFTHVDQLIMARTSLVDIHPSIGKLSDLQMLSLPYNKITELPKEIGNLNKLEFMNIVGNNISVIPKEISKLDKSNGGSLHRLACKVEDLGSTNYERLKNLLPTTEFD